MWNKSATSITVLMLGLLALATGVATARHLVSTDQSVELPETASNLTAAEEQTLLEILQHAPKYSEPTAGPTAGKTDPYLAALANTLPEESSNITAGGGRRLSQLLPNSVDIRARHTGWSRCMDIQWAWIGTDMSLTWNWDCNLGSAQRFFLVHKGTFANVNYYQIRTGGGKCVDISSVNMYLTYPCRDNIYTQYFRFETVAGFNGVYTIRPFSTGQCMEVVGSATFRAAYIQQAICNGGTNQHFWVRPF